MVSEITELVIRKCIVDGCWHKLKRRGDPGIVSRYCFCCLHDVLGCTVFSATEIQIIRNAKGEIWSDRQNVRGW